jgi:sec-independent protein translocase protein TatC
MPDDRELPDSGARGGDEPLPDDVDEGDGFAFVGDAPDAGSSVDVDDAGIDWADPDSLADHADRRAEGADETQTDEEADADDETGAGDETSAEDLANAVEDAGIDWGAHDDLLSDSTDEEVTGLVADAGEEGDADEQPADADDKTGADNDRSPTYAARAGESVVSRTDADEAADESGAADERAGAGENADNAADNESPTPVEPDGPPDHMEPTPPVTEADQRGAADGGTAQVAGATPPGMPEGDDGLLGQGPDEDVEMPLADHIEEMINRLAVVLLVGGVVALAVFPVADQLINYLWNAHIPGAAEIADRRPRLYGPLELPLTEIKIAVLAGLLVGLPVLVYQSYRFMRPGLYPRERRYYLAAVPTSLVLATVGVAFSHFVVLPAIFAYFTSYTTGTALVAFGLKETFNLILLLMGYMAVVFQIPLLIQLGIMMGLVSREWLEARRLLFWGGFAGLAFLVSPDPTGMAPIIIATTMIVLFEGTLTLLRWTGN